MASTNGHHFFISYSREDSSLQRRIIGELRNRDINVWVDFVFTYRGGDNIAQLWIMNRDGSDPHKFYSASRRFPTEITLRAPASHQMASGLLSPPVRMWQIAIKPIVKFTSCAWMERTSVG